MSVLKKLWLALTWLPRQVWGFFKNVWNFFAVKLRLRDVLIPSIYETLVWLKEQVPRAFGLRSPSKQIEASFVLGVAAFLSGFISAGATWLLIGVFAVTAAIGIVRFVPVVNKYWPLKGVGA